MTTIGVISDTHGLLRPEAVDGLEGVDLIVHAGDIGSREVINELSRIAPVAAIRGNVDTGSWSEEFPDTRELELCGKRIYVLHNLKELEVDPVTAGIDVVISGHSHKPGMQRKDGVLYLNPGSAGPRRFTLPVAIGRLFVSKTTVEGEVQELAV